MNDIAGLRAIADAVFRRCKAIAAFTEVPGLTTRTFLSQPMHECHAYLKSWMKDLGMRVSVDGMGNLRGVYPSGIRNAKRLIIASHLDTVPNAGAFDGVLGVVLGVALIQALKGTTLSFDLEVIGFSEEEGVRFNLPFLGSRALIGDIDDAVLARKDSLGISVEKAIRHFGCDPSRIAHDGLGSNVLAYLEFHIEQGPVLDSIGRSLGVVDSIVGQSRAAVRFRGKANHAGTTPMSLRQDALTGAAEWIAAIETRANSVPGLVATVGRIEVEPGAVNVIPGEARLTLDVRHSSDEARTNGLQRFLESGNEIAARRGLVFEADPYFSQPAVSMNDDMVQLAVAAVSAAGAVAYRMPSGAGHDAMIVAKRLPSVMIFLRTPGGISHHPDESVHIEDIEMALLAGIHFLHQLELRCTG